MLHLVLLQRVLKSGDECTECGTGTFTLRNRAPVLGKPGKSLCRFQCSECGSEKTALQDDRFIV